MRGKLPSLLVGIVLARITPARAGKTLLTGRRRVRAQDHPRACGENCPCHLSYGLPTGSPPRVRGKLPPPRSRRPVPGITPARAGKTYFVWQEAGANEDHPRACGENGTIQIENDSITGSPPRVRGKRRAAHHGGGNTGITPARAGKTVQRVSGDKGEPDHPRACGENFTLPLAAMAIRGSPPRVRGKPRPGEKLLFHSRITPARAGKTRSPCTSPGAPSDHPRACGENTAWTKRGTRRRITPRACGENIPRSERVIEMYGSPPRVRGKLVDGRAVVKDDGITPARAGKTRPAAGGRQRNGDHPRACRENNRAKPCRVSVRGSPPRVRGKLPIRRRPWRRTRITPARAGKTTAAGELRNPTADHPRACGENNNGRPVSVVCVGSPPRVRGKPDINQDGEFWKRITPARAGKTRVSPPPRAATTDHPRACGENLADSGPASRRYGSPPRVRGKPPLAPQPAHPSRITPARAGKTSYPRLSLSLVRDHPRACGENDIVAQPAGRVKGSPPRVRGKLILIPPLFLSIRITPARAGKTLGLRGRAGSPKDHPRACGENADSPPAAVYARGSPPRVRGKHKEFIGKQDCGRITPARAGKTRIYLRELLSP